MAEFWLNNLPCLKWHTIAPFVWWVHTVSQDLLRVWFHWSWENIWVFFKKQRFHLIFVLGWVQIMPEGLVASMAYRRIARTIQLLAGTTSRRLRSMVARKVTRSDWRGMTWRAYRWWGACMSCALLLTVGCELMSVYHYVTWGMTWQLWFVYVMLCITPCICSLSLQKCVCFLFGKLHINLATLERVGMIQSLPFHLGP